MSAHAYSTVDAQRLKLGRSVVLHNYLGKSTPLGTDHPAVLLAKRKELRANMAACNKLDAHHKQDLLHKAANKLTRENKMSEARPLLVEAKELSRQTTTAECEYDMAAAAHLFATKQALQAALLHAELIKAPMHMSVVSALHLLHLHDRTRKAARNNQAHEPTAHTAVLSTEAAANAPSLSTAQSNSANFFYSSHMTQKGACN
tara:strand:+ start:635 stop:1243 length:609 start_codon:yes stop_codon:yes gene_type:complete